MEAQEPMSGTVRPEAFYVHVPFCSSKCGYCDFVSVAGQDDLIDAYLDALQAEMTACLDAPQAVRTVYVGGGTPTFLAAGQLERLLAGIHRWLRPATIAEYSVESNPNTLDAEKVRVLAEYGVNRVSLGAQSFRPALLAQLGRDHDPQSAKRAVDLLRSRIDNISLDLMFGIPGQTLRDWQSDVSCALQLQPKHLSTYCLSYEQGTRLWQQRQNGSIRPLDEDTEARMYEYVIDRLTAEGWDHYEISNFAWATPKEMGQGRGVQARLSRQVPPKQHSNLLSAGQRYQTYRCQHNLVYWANGPYYGFGSGAAAFVDGVRSVRVGVPRAYIACCTSGKSPIIQSETLDVEARARETAMLGLRRLDGLDRNQFERQTGLAIDKLAGQAIRRLVEQGMLEDDGKTIRLTRQALPLADSVLCELL